MSAITDDIMKAMLGEARPYTVALLQPGPRYAAPAVRSPEVAAIVWEHGRRNFELRAAGQIALVGPSEPDAPFVGMAVFNTTLEEARSLLDADPAVAAGVFTYQLAPWWSFPGDALPG